MPLLFLSARGDDSDKLRGLGSAPTTTSSSPRRPPRSSRASRRCCAARRRRSAPRTRCASAAAIDLAAHEVALGDRPVALTAREFELLRAFAEHPRQVLSRDQLFELLWGSWGDRSTVSVYVRKLREKLEADPDPQLLVTVWGVGYRFDPPVAR